MAPELATGRRPNLVIAWVSKAGTTSMFHYLGQHPDVGTSDVKEVRYFTPLRYGEELEPIDNKTQQYRNKSLQRAAVVVNRRAERLFHNHQEVKRVLRRGYYSINRARTAPAMPPATRARLSDFYRPHNALLAEQLAEMSLSLPPSWSRNGGA